jgi:hypothetical protein
VRRSESRDTRANDFKHVISFGYHNSAPGKTVNELIVHAISARDLLPPRTMCAVSEPAISACDSFQEEHVACASKCSN